MLLNSVPLNGSSLGSGSPSSRVYAITSQIVQVTGQFKAVVIGYAKATQAATVSGVQGSALVLMGAATGIASTVGTAIGGIYQQAAGTVTQAASAVGTVVASVYHSVYGTADSVVRGLGDITGRWALRGTTSGTATVSGTQSGYIIQFAEATQVCEVVVSARAIDIPTGPAPEERTFQLTAGDRVFVLPKD